MSSTSRRKFLAASGVGAAASLGMPGFIKSSLAQSAATPPKRFMLIFMPNANLRDQWVSTGGRDVDAGTGTATTFTLNKLAMPFDPIKQYTTFIHGISMASMKGDLHSSAQIRVTTGADVRMPMAGGGGNNLPGGPSLDTLAANEGTVINGAATKFRQVVVNADTRSPSLHHQCITSAMNNDFIAPDNLPITVYNRLFADVTVGGTDAERQAALLKMKARKKSVLDFITADLGKLNARIPVAQRPKLDSHLAGIRALEKSLDAQVAQGSVTVTLPMGLQTLKANTSANHPQVVQGFFDVIKTAFQLDLTRVASFSFGTGNNAVSFADFGGGPSGGVHDIAHQSVSDTTKANLATIAVWYNQKVTAFVQALAAIPEGNGTMLDNTLIYYFSETAQYHEHNDIPLALIGGKNFGLVGGRVLRYKREVNDVGMSILKALGTTRATFGNLTWFKSAAPEIFV